MPLFIPDELLGSVVALLIVCLGLALMVGALKRAQVFEALGWVVGLLILSPFLAALVEALPTWLLLLLMVAVAFFLVRTVLEFVLGKQGASEFLGKLAWELFASPFRMIRWLFSRRRYQTRD